MSNRCCDDNKKHGGAQLNDIETIQDTLPLINIVSPSQTIINVKEKIDKISQRITECVKEKENRQEIIDTLNNKVQLLEIQLGSTTDVAKLKDNVENMNKELSNKITDKEKEIEELKNEKNSLLNREIEQTNKYQQSMDEVNTKLQHVVENRQKIYEQLGDINEQMKDYESKLAQIYSAVSE